MEDYFTLLGVPRRPWLDSDELKARFHTLSAEMHPDRWHNATERERQDANQRYRHLNAAYSCLREHKERLRHLLELERGCKSEPLHAADSASVDLFQQVSLVCRETDALLAENSSPVPGVLKAQRVEKCLFWVEKLNALQQTLNAKSSQLQDHLKNLNLAWESAPPVGSSTRANALPCSRVEHIVRELSYLARWTQQIQERVVRLSP